MVASRTEALYKSDVAILSPKDILLARIEAVRLETIPLERVMTESSLIDDAHASELGKSMKQKRGQITPIAVRARISKEDGEIIYDIIDGFHRTAGKKLNGDTEINATIIYGCPDEEMFDLRILAASSVRSVQFARVAEWITSSFSTTPWAEKGLSVSQAFNIAHNNSNRSHIIDITPEEMNKLKDWVKGKSTRWGKPLSSLYQDLKLVANADPELVKEVRIATGGHSRERRITQAKLAYVVNAFPGKEHHLVQREILHFATANRLKIDQIKAIVENLRDKIKPGITEEEVVILMKNINLERVSKKNEFAAPTRRENLDETNDPLILQKQIIDLELTIKRLREANGTLATRLAQMSRLQNLKPASTNERVIFQRSPNPSPALRPSTTASESESNKKPDNNSARITKENVNSFIPEFTEEQLRGLEVWDLQKLKGVLATIPKSNDIVSSQRISIDLVQAVMFVERAIKKKLVSLADAENSDFRNIEVIGALETNINALKKEPSIKNASHLFTVIKNALIKSVSPA